ncbi:hypothetical protein CK203_107146 [Vitis vinifera]|uniref:Uncharacterized protein n=1 Tax=Vitis vinifera TaxID=29760 RepID=A0A438CVQ5_VITVI|nr:hypothetical protein CK203_107146 [Vitis vinifera]
MLNFFFISQAPLFQSPIPSLSSFLHHSPLSTPPWQPISITPLHSRGITIHHRPPFNFQLFPPSKTSQFFTQHSKSILNQSALYLPNQSLKLRFKPVFFKETHCRRPAFPTLKSQKFSPFERASKLQGRFSISYPPNPKPLSLISLLHMPKTRGGHTSAPRASRYHTRRASATPVAPTQIPPRVLLQRKPRLQSQESPLEHLGIHSLSLLPPGALDPARPLRATQIADPKHFMSRHILITLFCATD